MLLLFEPFSNLMHFESVRMIKVESVLDFNEIFWLVLRPIVSACPQNFWLIESSLSFFLQCN